MDYFRRFFGLPNHNNNVTPPEIPRNDIVHPDGFSFNPGETIIIEDVPIEHDDHFGVFGNGGFAELDREFREMERQMKDMWSAFGAGPNFFGEDMGKLFEGFGRMMPPMIGPENQHPDALPAPHEPDSLREKMFKVPPSSDPSVRRDVDIDTTVERDGASSLFNDNTIQIQPRNQFTPNFRSFSKSISVQTIRRPDGSMETRRVERDSDGNETVTVTEIPSDGSNLPILPPSSNSPNDRQDLSILDRFFKK